MQISPMKSLAHLPLWLRSKFFIAFAAFTVWMLFFDEKDVFTMRHHRQELYNLQQSKKYYTDQINRERIELENLKNNPAILEKYARENYYMKRDNEDLFLIPEKQAN
jgi:cell division protein FtsB